MLIDILVTILTLLVILLFLYFLAVQGRRDHPGLQDLRGWNYAHRGLHDEDKPENSMAAFRSALEKGYGIELDVHLLKDGNLAVFHDYMLERMTGAAGKIEELTTGQLKDYCLEGTQETIPTFQQVLDLYQGKAPLIVELKSDGDNYAQLAHMACNMLEDYSGVYCLESFDPRCIGWLRQNRPHLIRGQLTENFFASKTSTLPWYVKLAMTYQLLNFMVQPDFVAYKYRDRKKLGNFLVRRAWGVQGVAWTLKTPQEHESAVQEGWIPIFEDYEP